MLASPFSDQDEEWFAYVREIGYDLIEVCIESPEQLSPDFLVEQSTRHSLPISICGALVPNRDVSSEDEAIRQSGIEYLKTCVDYAHAVNSPHVAGPMYAATGRTQMLDSSARRAQRSLAAAGLRQVADYADAKGVSLAIEPLNRFETDLVNTVEQAVGLLEEIDRENVGLMLDTFHMNIEEKNIGDAIRFGGSRVIHFQVSENDRGTPGDGHVPWKEVWAALRDISYEGSIVVESFLPSVAEIARAVSLWRPVAESMDTLSRDGLKFLEKELR